MISKFFAVLVLVVLGSQANANSLGAMKSINCQYVDKTGTVRHPVVHTHNDTVVVKGAEDSFDKITRMTVSVAYLVKGAQGRQVEDATVQDWSITGPDGYQDSKVTAVGDKSGRTILILFKNWGGKSVMFVDGEEQRHMTGLTCSLGLGA